MRRILVVVTAALLLAIGAPAVLSSLFPHTAPEADTVAVVPDTTSPPDSIAVVADPTAPSTPVTVAPDITAPAIPDAVDTSAPAASLTPLILALPAQPRPMPTPPILGLPRRLLLSAVDPERCCAARSPAPSILGLLRRLLLTRSILGLLRLVNPDAPDPGAAAPRPRRRR